MSTSDTHDVSNDITPLDVVIRDYLLRIDRGEVVSHKELLASHPDLQDDLKAFLEGVAIVQRMAGAPSALTDTSPPTKFDTKFATVAAPEGSSNEISKTSLSKSAADLSGPFPIMLGQYRILKNIGQGAMGAVYVADDIRLGRKVALKVPLAAVAERPDHLDRFTREARASAQLRHHNICPVYEVNEQDGVQYIAMAYIEGQPLLEVLRKNRRFSGKQIAVTIRKIALALDVAHRAGIVHRDLKPANIMIDKDGEPIVMDFGLARQMHSVDQAQLTQEGAILGTPAYMSPEQVRSELQRIGPASDIYSLGVILYELLCGSHPFRGPLMTVLMNVADNNLQPPKPSEVRPNCDPQLEAICLRMISKRIADRYLSMKDVAAALSNYIKTGKTAPEIPIAESPVKRADAGPVAIPPGNPIPLQNIEPLKTESAGTKKPPRRRMGVLLGGLFAALLAGVIIITITTQDGKKTVLKVPEGREIDIPAAPGAKVSIAVATDPQPAADGKKSTGWHGWPADAPPPAIAPFNAEQAKKHQEAWAKYLKVPVEYTNSIGMKFALIPPGEFMMGSSQEEIDSELKTLGKNVAEGWDIAVASEGPKRHVTITQPLYVGIHEVSRGDYEKVLQSSQLSSEVKDQPAEALAWADAVEFCLGLCRLEQLPPYYFLDTHLQGSGYRLLTEAEWEYACRAGTTTRYWSGDAVESFLGVGWCKENADGQPHNVGTLPSNPFGLHDMLGGVWEFVIDGNPDWFVKDPPSPSELSMIDPMCPVKDYSIRVIRGGDCTAIAAKCRSAIRTQVKGRLALFAGFRVALTVDAVRRALKVDGPSPHAPRSARLVSSTDYSADRRAADHIARLGGTIVLESAEIIAPYGVYPFVPSHIRKIRLEGSAFGDAELQQIETLSGLHVLELDGTAITTEGLARYLASSPQLKSLDLNGLTFKDDKLDFTHVPGLRDIALPQGTNNDALKHLTAACPVLKKISLPRSAELELQPLAPLKYLAELSCSGELLTDEGIKSLAAIPSLRKLILHSPIDNDVARRVATLGTQLQSLELVYSEDDSTPLTDDGYRHLARSLRLFELTIRGKPLNPALLMSLAAAMPDLRTIEVHGDHAEKAFSPAGIANFQRRHPSVNLTLGNLVIPAFISWPSGSDGAVGDWKLPEGAPAPVIAPLSLESAQQLQIAWSKFLKTEVETKNSVDIPLRLIPPGEFIYPYPSRQPPHVGAVDGRKRSLARVLKPYYLGATEVTIQQFESFITETGYKTTAEKSQGGVHLSAINPSTFDRFDLKKSWNKPGSWTTRPGDPVTQISLDDANAYCGWLSKKEGAVYRLPRESEWFYAFWAGSALKWGIADSAEELQKFTRFQNTIPLPHEDTTSPYLIAGAGPENAFGLHEMLGNVWEWSYGDFNDPPASQPIEDDASLRKPMITLNLGGGWEAPSSNLVSPWINVPNTSEKRYPNLGFRVLREVALGPDDDVQLAPKSLLINHGKPLSQTSKVSRPTPIAGLRSWSVEPKRNSGHMEAIAHHPTQDQLVTGGSDGSIRIWSAKGELLKCLLGHAGSITSVRFFDQGAKILSSDVLGEIRIWNSEMGTVLYSHQSGAVMPVALSPNEKTIAGLVINEWMLLTDVLAGTLRGERAIPGGYQVAWSPDSRYIATTSSENAIYIWQVNPWRQVAKVPQICPYLWYAETSQTLTWSPDGKTIAFNPCDADKVFLIDASTFTLIPGFDRTLTNKWGGRSPVWSHDGRHLAVGHLSGCVVFEFATGKIKCQLPGAEGLCWSSDDSKVYLTTGECFDASTGEPLHRIDWREKTSKRSISLSPDGRFISSTDEAGQTSVWTAAAGQLQASWMGEAHQSAPFWTPDGASAVVMTEGKLEFLDPASGVATRSIMAHPNGIHAAVFSPNGQWVATSGRDDSRLCVFDSSNGKSKWIADTKGSRADCIAWSPDAKKIVTGHRSSADLRIWSLEEGKLLKTYGPSTSKMAFPFSNSFHDMRYLDWSLNPYEILAGQGDIAGFHVNLDSEQIEYWGWHNLRGGHANQNRLAPDREVRLLHNELGLSMYRGLESSHFVGQLGRNALWMPDSRRALLEPEDSSLYGYDLATYRRLGTLRQSSSSNLWLCIGPTGHYHGGFVNQPGDGTDPKALSQVEDFLVYVGQLDDGGQVTYSPKEFAEKFGWKNDPRQATLMKLNPD